MSGGRSSIQGLYFYGRRFYLPPPIKKAVQQLAKSLAGKSCQSRKGTSLAAHAGPKVEMKIETIMSLETQH